MNVVGLQATPSRRSGLLASDGSTRGRPILAGQESARANGKTWGGSRQGVRRKVTPEQVTIIRRMKDEDQPVAAIARATGLSRPTVYSVLGG